MNQPTNTNGNDASMQPTEMAELLGKKSVRATFKLHPTAIQLVSVLAAQLGIKQKSLFDYLMEDEDALQAMAESLPNFTAEKEQRVQKTFVVSQRSLAALDAVAKHSPSSRNDLIERSIQRLLPILEKERIRQKRREAALTRIVDHFQQGIALVDEVKDMVGNDDTLYQSLLPVISTYGKAVAEIEKLVNKGKCVSNFPMDALKRE